MPHSRTRRSHTTASSITIIASIASLTVAAETTSTLATTIAGAGFGPRMDRSGLMSATTATSVLGIAANENEARAVMGSRLLFGRSHKKSNVASAAFGLPVGGVALVLLLAILCSSGPN